MTKAAGQLATWATGKLDAMATGFAEQLGKSLSENLVTGITFHVGLLSLAGVLFRLVDLVAQAF